MAAGAKAVAKIKKTLVECIDILEPILGQKFKVPKTKNKGGAGHYLETILGVQHSSDCLDCSDGELKAFPLKQLKNGTLVPKETVAVTMCCIADLKTQPFTESRVCKKLSQVLLIPYLREGEYITFYLPEYFSASHVLWSAVEKDYLTLQEEALRNRVTGSIGEYLQTRTKGSGHGSKSRAFYLRPKFLKEVFNNIYLM